MDILYLAAKDLLRVLVLLDLARWDLHWSWHGVYGSKIQKIARSHARITHIKKQQIVQRTAKTLQCTTILDCEKDENMLTASLGMLLGCTKSVTMMSRPVPKASLLVRGQRLRY